jgi:4-aminobutyrate aminotransferase / (S)-3-amino-2-methylpropionate transaminase / 5-aminovalerate transaminase
MAIANVKGPLPGEKGKALLEKWHKYEADVVGYQAPVVWKKAKGCVVTDVDDNTYIDWTSGVLVTNVGHCHQHLVDATKKASDDLLNNYECCNTYRVQAAEKLVNALPGHMDKCFFLSTGSEAIEASLRLMKRYTGNFEVISFEGGFHGRTPGAASVGGLAGPKKKYGPTIPGTIRAPYPNPYRDPLGFCDDGPEFKKYFDFLEYVIATNSTGSLAGVIVEPYQGAGGFIFPPKGWLTRLRRWARDKGLLFTLDEVQASYGRTGKMWAMDHEELEPDILALGKGIGSGVSVSAVCSTSEIFSCLAKGEMSSTYGGNPVSSAAVTAVLEIFEREALIDNAVKMGDYIKKRLLKMADDCPYLGDVRGMGLVMGMEFVSDKKTKAPAPQLIKQLIDKCANSGLLIGSVGMYGNVIRVAPPLVITKEQADESLAIMEKVLKSLEL